MFQRISLNSIIELEQIHAKIRIFLRITRITFHQITRKIVPEPNWIIFKDFFIEDPSVKSFLSYTVNIFIIRTLKKTFFDRQTRVSHAILFFLNKKFNNYLWFASFFDNLKNISIMIMFYFLNQNFSISKLSITLHI